MNAPNLSKSSYKTHGYSGPKSNRKRVRAQLKRFHGEDVSRADAWRKKSKPNLPSSSSDVTPSNVKKYDSAPRQFLVEADINIPLPQQKATPDKGQELNVDWPITDPTLDSHQLTIEVVQRENLHNLSGYRIVDLQHVLYWAFELERHRSNCSNSVIEFLGESRSGFNSLFTFKCTMCDKEFRKSNEKQPTVNKAFVLGTVTGGSYFAQSSHLTNLMDIPTMSPNMYRDIENMLGDVWEE